MYYNQSTMETAISDEVRRATNCSFAEGTETVGDWLFVHEEMPAAPEGKMAVPGRVEVRDGKAYRTYEMADAPKVPEAREDADRMTVLEQAVMDLAQMVSNLEEYRMLAEREKEEAANPEQNAE